MPKPNPTPNSGPSGPRLAEALLNHRPWLRSVLLARLQGDEATADDILSGLYAELLRSGSGRGDIESVAPWLYRTTVNRATDWLRRHQRMRRIQKQIAHDPTLTTEIDDRTLPPLDQLLLQERQQSVRDALHTLAAEDVEILMLKYCHGWSYVDLDEHLGIGRHKIAHRLRTARSRLKNALLQTGHADELRTLEKTRNEH